MKRKSLQDLQFLTSDGMYLYVCLYATVLLAGILCLHNDIHTMKMLLWRHFLGLSFLLVVQHSCTTYMFSIIFVDARQ